MLYIQLCLCVYVTHLKELGADFELRWLAAGLLGAHPPVLDSLKQLVNGPWDDALLLLAQAHIKARPHGVGLPRPRLKHITSNIMRFHFPCSPNIIHPTSMHRNMFLHMCRGS